MARTGLFRVRAASLALSGALFLLAVILFISAPASLAQETFTISVSVNTGAGPRTIEVHVTMGGSHLSGSKTWSEGTTEHSLDLTGTLETGLDGKARIILDVNDDWNTPSTGEGDPGT